MSDRVNSQELSARPNRALISRRRFLHRMAIVAGSLGVGMGLIQGCGPAAAPAPTTPPAPAATAPSKPAEAAKPAAAAPTAAAAPAKGRPAPKGRTAIAVGEEAQTLSSWEAYNLAGLTVLRNIQEALLNRDPKTNELVGELATKWEPTNPTTWRFSLRKDVKFHDGSPFDAEAAAFGINYSWDKKNNFLLRSYIGPEMNAKAVDQYTLDVVTESPDPILPSRLYFSPLPSMKALKEKPAEYLLKPIGTGPYRFVEWAKGQQVKMEANPDWWGNAADDARGAVTIKEAVVVGPRPEREVRAAMVKAGEADMARWLSREQCQATAQCEKAPSVETPFLRLDMPNPAMKDRRVREAIALAVDKKVIMDEILGGGVVAAQMVGPSALGFNPDLKPYPYDPTKAKSLVAEAKAAGVPVDTPLIVYIRKGVFPGFEEAGEAIADMIAKVGLNVKPRIVERQAFNDMVQSGRQAVTPDRGMIALHLHGNEIMDFSSTVASYYLCEARNATYCDPKIDEMHKAAQVLTGEARAKAYREIAKYIQDQVAFVPIGHVEVYFGLSKRLTWKPRLDGFVLFKEMTLKD